VTRRMRPAVSFGIKAEGAMANLPLALRIGLAPSLAVALWSSDSAAQQAPPAEQAAEVFARGLELERAEKWGDALKSFENAQALAGAETAQLEFHVARCQRRLGQILDARPHLVRAVELAHNAGTSKVEKAAQDELNDVTARIPMLTIAGPAGAGLVSVTVDDRPVPVESLGVPLPLNATEHVVLAQFASGSVFRRTVNLKEGAKDVLQVEPLEPATRAPPPTPPPVPGSASTTTIAPASVTQGNAKARSSANTLGWVLLGGGGVAVAGGVVFWILRGNEISALTVACGQHHCPPASQGDYNNGKLYDAFGITLFAAGGAALAAGGVALFYSHQPASITSARLFPWAYPRGAGVAVEGRF
jgi:tetratricopeptide (TPR) repeat protein